jgi:hypothetical protein
MKKKLIVVLLLLVAAVSNVSGGFLADAISERFVNIICGIFNGLKLVGGGVASLVFVYAGIKWITEADDPGARKNARDNMKWAIVGILVIIMSDALVGYVAQDPNTIKTCSYWCTIVKC